MEKGIKKVFPKAEIILAPMADGGEGTTDALIDATEGRRVFKNVRGPLENSEVEAYFGYLRKFRYGSN
ncbi:Glycerate 2-kinase [Lactococcus lactis]|nr:Glycerate 2-kinase [Lactococcus lactis]